jgi:DNA-directed RNA polymerase specialized sigma subunit
MASEVKLLIDKDQLEQLYHLNREIELLKRQIDNMNEKPKIVSDSVTASSRSFPYTEHLVIISGVEDLGDKMTRLKIRIAKMLRVALDKVDELNTQIETIQDSEIRQIITLRYINNLTWQQVALAMGTQGDGSTERKKCDRFLEVSHNS